MISFLLNNEAVSTSRPPGSLLLDLLREDLRMTGTREGCREGDCGACTVLLGTPDERGDIDYRAVNACLLPLGEVAARHVVTIEALRSPALTPVQAALVEEGAIQCGFCTPGIVMSLTAFALAAGPHDGAAARDAAGGNICRCTGYASIRRAMDRMVDVLAPLEGCTAAEQRASALAHTGIVPAWLTSAPDRLRDMRRHAAPAGGVLVGGGTDLFVQRPDELEEAPLRFLSDRPDLRYIREEGGRISIGGAATLADMEASSAIRRSFPSVREDFALIASRQIRNRATAAGNIVNASPAADVTAWLLPLDTLLTLEIGTTRRTLPLVEFFLTYKSTALLPGEIISAIRVPIPPPGSAFHFEKVSCREHMDIAAVNSGMTLRYDGTVLRDVRISAGGVAPVPLLLRRTMDSLEGRPPTAAVVRDAAAAAVGEISPISDVRGSAEYKRRLLERLLMSHLLALCPGMPAGSLLP